MEILSFNLAMGNIPSSFFPSSPLLHHDFLFWRAVCRISDLCRLRLSGYPSGREDTALRKESKQGRFRDGFHPREY